jgi:hypothetical protein
LQHFESLSGFPVLALCECQYPLQECFDWPRSDRSRRQGVGIGFHLRIAKDVFVASLRCSVAYKMCGDPELTTLGRLNAVRAIVHAFRHQPTEMGFQADGYVA